MLFRKNKVNDLEKLTLYNELIDLSETDKQEKIKTLHQILTSNSLQAKDEIIARLELRYCSLDKAWQASIVERLKFKVEGIVRIPTQSTQEQEALAERVEEIYQVQSFCK